MQAVLDGRDSLVVLPTGGGKSLCYQAPAVLRGGTTVVVSPLIALMKDQVDGLRACGVPAVQLDSSPHVAERNACEKDLRQGNVRLLFVSPERLVQTELYRILQRRSSVHTFAIDEAHCISHWGHDFRPEYRQLGRLHEFFPQAARPRLHRHGHRAGPPRHHRRSSPCAIRVVLVGNFDRPNLTYRVLPRHDLMQAGRARCSTAMRARPASSTVCAARTSTSWPALCKQGHPAPALSRRHERRRTPGRPGGVRRRTLRHHRRHRRVRHGHRSLQHAFRPAHGDAEVDRALPAGDRAGRARWAGGGVRAALLRRAISLTCKSMLRQVGGRSRNATRTSWRRHYKHLEDMDRYCRGAVCRHQALVQYFGQEYERNLVRGLRPVPGRHRGGARRHRGGPEDPVLRGPRQGELRHQPRRRRAARRKHREHPQTAATTSSPPTACSRDMARPTCATGSIS